MTPGQLIARHRRAEPYSRERFAELTGLTPRQVERIEAGRPIRLDEAVRACEVLPELTLSRLVDALAHPSEAPDDRGASHRAPVASRHG